MKGSAGMNMRKSCHQSGRVREIEDIVNQEQSESESVE